MNSSVSKPDVPKPEVSKPDVPKPDVSNKTSNDVPGLKTVYGTTNCPTYIYRRIFRRARRIAVNKLKSLFVM